MFGTVLSQSASSWKNQLPSANHYSLNGRKLMLSRGFTKPQLDYKLQTLFPSRSWAKDVDRSLCSTLKKGLHLPGRTISDFLYCHQDDGGQVSVPSIEDDQPSVKGIRTSCTAWSRLSPTQLAISSWNKKSLVTQRGTSQTLLLFPLTTRQPL